MEVSRIERVSRCLQAQGQEELTTHFIFESRGPREDDQLELEFRRVCDGSNFRKKRFPFEILFASKQSNSCGLQIADLIARPVGRHVLKPDQANRAFEVIKEKLDRGPNGNVHGYGLKVFP